MSKGSKRKPEDAYKVSSNWDKIFGNKYHSIIVDELQEPEAGIYPYEMQRKMSEHLYKIKEAPSVEQTEEFWKLQAYHYGL